LESDLEGGAGGVNACEIKIASGESPLQICILNPGKPMPSGVLALIIVA
jgi:hypothetical protein